MRFILEIDFLIIFNMIIKYGSKYKKVLLKYAKHHFDFIPLGIIDHLLMKYLYSVPYENSLKLLICIEQTKTNLGVIISKRRRHDDVVSKKNY